MTATEVTGWRGAVGGLVHQGAVAEAAVARLARLLSGIDDAASGQLLPLELEQLIRVVRNLLPLRVHDVRVVGDVLDWTHQVRKLYAVRTSVVHTVWVPDGETDAMRPEWSSAGAAEGPIRVADVDRTTERLARLCAEPLDNLLVRTARWTTAPAPVHG